MSNAPIKTELAEALADVDFTEHAHLSPSGSKKWFSCAGSLVLEAPIPNKSNEHSDRGTACHWVAAACLEGNLRAASFVGELIPVHYKTEPPRYVRFTDEMADQVQDGYVDPVRAQMIGSVYHCIEERVNFSHIVGIPNQFGTLDAGIVSADGELTVADAKFGHTPVEVEENTQLLIYAVALYDEVSLIHDVKAIRLQIHQPAVAGTTEWACSLEYLEQFRETLRQKASTTVGAAEMFTKWPREQWDRIYLNPNPNDKECAFCRATAICPSAQAKIQRDVGADFSAIVEAQSVPFQVTDENPVEGGPMYGPADLGTLMQAAPFVEDFFKSVRAEVERRLLAGEAVPGFGLELGRKGARRFSDEKAAEDLIRKVWRLKLEDTYDLSLKSPTGFEKMTKPTVDEKGEKVKPLIGTRRWKDLCKLVVQNDPKPSVRPLSVIKTPYTPPRPDADAFAAVPADDDLWN